MWRGGGYGVCVCACVVSVDRLGFIAAGAVFVLVQYFEYKVGYVPSMIRGAVWISLREWSSALDGYPRHISKV